MKTPTCDYFTILETLANHQVDFIVVGGVCAVLHGAPITTFDLDVVHSRDHANLSRLLKALEAMDAFYRGRGEQRLRPELSNLDSPGHHLLATSVGPLDLLGIVGSGHTYQDLLPDTMEMKVGDLTVRVLGLKKLIQVKEETPSEKDRYALVILRRTLEEKQNH